MRYNVTIFNALKRDNFQAATRCLLRAHVRACVRAAAAMLSNSSAYDSDSIGRCVRPGTCTPPPPPPRSTARRVWGGRGWRGAAEGHVLPPCVSLEQTAACACCAGIRRRLLRPAASAAHARTRPRPGHYRAWCVSCLNPSVCACDDRVKELN